MPTPRTLVNADTFTAHRRRFAATLDDLLQSPEVLDEGETILSLLEGYSYEVASPVAADHHLQTQGGMKLYCKRPAGGFSLTQWGVKPNDISSTAKAQAAIDALIETGETFVRLPAGHFIFEQLRLHNAAGGDRAQRGKFRIVGAGNLSHSDVYNGETVGDFYGTLIEIQGADPADAGIIAAEGDGLQRRVQIEDLTVIYGGTGYAIDARYCPFLEMRNVSVRITSAGGKGLNIEDAWGGLLDRVVIRPDKSVVSTTHGVRFASTLFAGNFKIRDSVIDYFDINLWFADTSSNFANVILENTWLQKFRTNGILCEAPLWNLVLRDEYMETAGGLNDDPPTVAAGAFIKADSAATIFNLEIDGAFFIGGTSTEAWVTDPMIDLTNVKQAKLSRVKMFRPWGPLLHLNDGCAVTLDGVDVQHPTHANLPAGPIYMITAEAGFYPKVELRRSSITDTTKLEWAYPAEVALSLMDGDGYHMRGPVSRGLLPVTIGLGSAYTWSTETVRPNAIVVSATAGTAGSAPVAARLLTASGRVAGEEYRVFNSDASTQDVLIRNGSSGTNLATVQPGEVATCYADPDNNEWIITITTFTAG